MNTKDVCIGCNCRTDQDIPAETRYGPKYNPTNFCHLGYKQNPKSPLAILHTEKAGGIVCRRIKNAYLLKEEATQPTG